VSVHVFDDGSALTVAAEENWYLLTDRYGKTLAEGWDYYPPEGFQDTDAEVFDDLADFLLHDGERWDMSPEGYWGRANPRFARIVTSETRWVFGPSVGRWAAEHMLELQALVMDDHYPPLGVGFPEELR